MISQRLLGSVVGVVLCLLAGCQDPNNPQTWIKRLKDPRQASQAVKRLAEIGDPVAVQPLCQLFAQFESPEILKAIISFKDRRAIPTLIEALKFTEDTYHNATLAAEALVELQATEAVPALVAVLERPLTIKSRANVAKLSAITALSQLQSLDAVPALITVASGVPEEQDFFLNKQAIRALGVLGDPRAVPVLLRGLFMASTVQGSSFPEARVALVRIGDAAVPALVAALQGRDAEINALAERLKVERGVIVGKIAIVLGDMLARDAVPELLAMISGSRAASDTTMVAVIEALGKIGDGRALAPLVALLKNSSANYRLRMQAATAVALIPGARGALPVLLDLAERGYLPGGYTDLREAAAMAYARMVGQAAADGYPKLKALVEAEKKKGYKATVAVFEEALERVAFAVICRDDAECYGRKASESDSPLVLREKAGFMLAILPDARKALPDLTQALPVREPIVRLALLQAAGRIGHSGDKELIAVLAELSERDAKRRVEMLGADLATANQIALALVQRRHP